MTIHEISPEELKQALADFVADRDNLEEGEVTMHITLVIHEDQSVGAQIEVIDESTAN